MKNVFYLVLLVMLTACAQQPTVIERIPFNVAEFSSLKKIGNATVTGHAFIKARDGKIYYAEKVQARLNPITTYSRQWYDVHYKEKIRITDADPRYLKYVYKADIDTEGRFTFNNIPAGDYYLSAPIFWVDEIKMADGSVLLKRQGSFICFEIHVERGNTLVTNITNQRTADVALSM